MVAVSNMTSSTAKEGVPILSRLDRIDVMLRQLEEIKGCNNIGNNNPMHTSSHASAKSSCKSTPSSGGSTLTSEYYSSTVDNVSPRSLEKHCRPIQSVMVETGAKGTLIERLDHVEERVLKMCMRLEEELEAHAAERRRNNNGDIDVVKVNVDLDDEATRRRISVSNSSAPREKMMKRKRGFKELVKQCVTGKTN